ncbi:MAG TPA: tRNA pseudouridine(38-40) synthase TruA [Demequinaceae bacterium]
MTDSAIVVRVRLDLSYDGTDFAGWADQPELRTVQGTLEAALKRVVRAESLPRLVVAGRTDAGVHARGQVAHLDIPLAAWRRLPSRSRPGEAESLVARLNGVLPSDIIVRAASEAPPGFDARFSASERRYAYRISDAGRSPDPLVRRHVLAYPRALDVGALTEASRSLTGLRDFCAFCRPRTGATTIRDLRELSWRREESGADAALVVATVRADAFCHSMVRSLVGAVLAVGDGRRDAAWLRQVASSPHRSPAIAVAPGCGLTLEEVAYPTDAEVALRAAHTRGRRTLN